MGQLDPAAQRILNERNGMGQTAPTQPTQPAPQPAIPARNGAPGVIQGPTNPVQNQREQIGLDQAQVNLEKSRLELQQQQLDNATRELETKLGKEAGFYLRAASASPAYDALEIGPEGQFRATVDGLVPDNWMNQFTSQERQMAEAVMRDFAMASLRYESGAAIPDSEIDSQIRTFFPVAGDSEATVRTKRQLRQNLIESLRMGAGPRAAQEVDTYLQGVDWNSVLNGPAQENAQAGGETAPAASSPGAMTNSDDSGIYDVPPDAPTDENGSPLILNNGEALIGYENGAPVYGPVEGNDSADSYAMRVARRVADMEEKLGEYGLRELLANGASLGLRDESGGVANVITAPITEGNWNVGENYRFGRDVEYELLRRARQREGGLGTAAELTGSVASVGGKAVSAPFTMQRAVTEGATIGAVAGYGQGRGLEGSLTEAAKGAGIGAAFGAATQKVGNALANRAVNRAPSAKAARGQQAADLEAAASRVGMQGKVNRAMADPRSNNAVTKSDASLVGGRTIQRGMGQVSDDFGAAVQSSLGGGKVLDKTARGETVRGASERWIGETGEIARRRYDRAEQIAGDARIEAQGATQQAQTILRRLRETPETNAEEIRAVERLVSDLAGPNGEGLSVGALRRMRTAMRKRISKGDLVFGEDEANVLAIMDAAADDIVRGLQAQGRGQAAEVFRTADTSYRARMDFIKNTMQRVIGRRGSDRSPAQIADTVASLSRKDSRDLARVYAMLNPEERLDMATTMAQQLGRKSTDSMDAPFSVSTFVTNTGKMEEGALRAVFGADGARAVKDLRYIGGEIARVQGSMNSRTSKSGVASYRDWLFSFIAGAAPGAASGNITTSAVVGAAAVGANAAKQGITARLLMSPKITRWARQAPNTNNPQAIDNHFQRLTEIARTEPALAAEIEALRRGMMQAANDNAGNISSSVANDEQN